MSCAIAKGLAEVKKMPGGQLWGAYLADSPAEVDIGGKVSSERQGSNLGGIGWTGRGKDTPGYIT